MIWLVLGVLLWSGVHLIPSLARPLRARLVETLGEGGYRAGFALAIVAAIILMVMGWRATTVVPIYEPPPWSRAAAGVLMFFALILFAAARLPSNIKRFLRHPQLTGVAVWAGAHLLANGDSRSLVLFGGFALWALLEMAFINRREGPWQRPERQPLMADLKPLLAGGIGYVLLLVLHPYLFGVSPLPAY
ncbi:MAG TPA: NnrU family protein [Candidatus Competibacteraceae bacterium]|nr:NnrU family protein [Candidatus Competibacteraceae bacterium]